MTSYQFAYGFVTTEDDSQITSLQTDMTRQLSTGTKFNGKLLNSEYQATTTEQTKDMMQYTGSNSTTQACPAPTDDPDSSIGHFVFVVDTADGKASAIQQAGICRYGDGYWNTAPDCPLAACIDAECKQCATWTDQE